MTAAPKLKVLYPYPIRSTRIYRTNKGLKTETYGFKNPSDIQAMQKALLYNSSLKPSYCLRNYLFFVLGVNTGFRASDLCMLRWSNIFHPNSSSFNNETWNEVVEEKTGKKRQVVINESSQKAILFYLTSLGITPSTLNPTDYVFKSRKGNTHINPDSMRKVIKEAAAQCHIPFNVGTHSMRKTFGYNLYKASNNDIGLVQNVLNHSSAKATLRYIGMDREYTRNAYSLLPDSTWTPN